MMSGRMVWPTAINWLQGFRDALATPKPQTNRGASELRPSAPVSDRSSASVMGDDVGMALLHDLSLRRQPLAVGFRIRAVIVDAIQSMAVWPIVHVGDEARGPFGGAPFVAHRNAARTVVSEGRIGVVVTPVDHGCPCVVQGMLGQPMSCHTFLNKTSARAAASPGKNRSDDFMQITA